MSSFEEQRLQEDDDIKNLFGNYVDIDKIDLCREIMTSWDGEPESLNGTAAEATPPASISRISGVEYPKYQPESSVPLSNGTLVSLMHLNIHSSLSLGLNPSMVATMSQQLMVLYWNLTLTSSREQVSNHIASVTPTQPNKLHLRRR